MYNTAPMKTYLIILSLTLKNQVGALVGVCYPPETDINTKCELTKGESTLALTVGDAVSCFCTTDGTNEAIGYRIHPTGSKRIERFCREGGEWTGQTPTCVEMLEDIVQYPLVLSAANKTVKVRELSDFEDQLKKFKSQKSIKLSIPLKRSETIRMTELQLLWTFGIKSVTVNGHEANHSMRWSEEISAPVIVIQNSIQNSKDHDINIQLSEYIDDWQLCNISLIDSKGKDVYNRNVKIKYKVSATKPEGTWTGNSCVGKGATSSITLRITPRERLDVAKFEISLHSRLDAIVAVDDSSVTPTFKMKQTSSRGAPDVSMTLAYPAPMNVSSLEIVLESSGSVWPVVKDIKMFHSGNSGNGTCGYPGKPEYAEMEMNRINGDSEALVTYHCPFGFHITGSATRQCVAGIWSGKPPYCERNIERKPDPLVGAVINCGSIPSVDMAEYEVLNTSTDGKPIKIEYSCQRGVLFGHSTIDCGEDGHWSIELPKCIERDSPKRYSQSDYYFIIIIAAASLAALVMAAMVVVAIITGLRARKTTGSTSDDKKQKVGLAMKEDRAPNEPSADATLEADLYAEIRDMTRDEFYMVDNELYGTR